MPTIVAMITRPTRVPASCGGKYSRTMIAYIGTMPPWNRPNSAEIDVERGRGRRTAGRATARRPAAIEPISSVRTPPMRSAMKPEAMRLTMPKPSISDSISAPRADAVAEVAAVGDDVHLRHRHGDAAGDAGEHSSASSALGEGRATGAAARRAGDRRVVLRPASGAAARAPAAAWSTQAEDADRRSGWRASRCVAMKC